jgi:hypothetical protein
MSSGIWTEFTVVVGVISSVATILTLFLYRGHLPEARLKVLDKLLSEMEHLQANSPIAQAELEQLRL